MLNVNEGITLYFLGSGVFYVIEVQIAPQKILSNHATSLELRIKNVSNGHCTGIRFSLHSSEAIVILEGRKVAINLLEAGAVYEHKIRVIAKRPGTFMIEGISIAYRTSKGSVHRATSYLLPLEVIGHSIPQLHLTLQNTHLIAVQWGKISGDIYNQANNSVEDIHLTVQGPTVSIYQEELFLELKPGESKPFALTVRFSEAGEFVPVEFEATYQDNEGKSYRQRWPARLSVQVAS